MQDGRVVPLRAHLHDVLESGVLHPRAAYLVGLGITTLVLLNATAVVLETLPDLPPESRVLLESFEAVSVVVFLAEYVARMYCIVEAPEFRAPLVGRLRYALRPRALIDLLAIAPSLLGAGGLDLRSLGLLRVIRLARLLKLGRYSVAVRTLAKVLAQSKGELGVFSFVAAVSVIICGSIMYYAEQAAQPQAFSSIPAGMWWAIATLTTVGYGDIYPVTPLGRFLASIIAFVGIGLFALPAGVLGGAFVEELRSRRRTSGAAVCPECGRPRDVHPTQG